jgi:uncharacterized protein
VSTPAVPAVRTVTATGSGLARVARDVATVRLTARHVAGTLADALAGAESAREQASAVCRRHVGDGAVGTTGLEVWPQRDADGGTSGFEARHGLLVRCDDLATAGALVGDLAAEVGDRMQLDAVNLAPRDTTEAQRLARERAVDDARDRAEHLAYLGGATLGPLVTIAEAGGPAVGGGGDARLMAKTAVGLEPGETDVTTSVTATWELG